MGMTSGRALLSPIVYTSILFVILSSGCRCKSTTPIECAKISLENCEISKGWLFVNHIKELIFIRPEDDLLIEFERGNILIPAERVNWRKYNHTGVLDAIKLFTNESDGFLEKYGRPVFIYVRRALQNIRHASAGINRLEKSRYA